MARVTVVNDNAEFLALVRDILEDDRYDVTTIDGDRPDALEAIVASRPELLMIDLRMGADGVHGWDVAQRARSEPDLGGLPILVCSADLQAMRSLEDDLDDAHRVGTLVKPFHIDQLTTAIDELLGEGAQR